MKTTSITPHEAAKIINRQFKEHELVHVSASELYDDECARTNEKNYVRYIIAEHTYITA